jgi:hypothetical protein
LKLECQAISSFAISSSRQHNRSTIGSGENGLEKTGKLRTPRDKFYLGSYFDVFLMVNLTSSSRTGHHSRADGRPVSSQIGVADAPA